MLDQFIHPTGPHIFSIGYEKRTLSDFLTILQKNHIKRILDVRRYPCSKYAWATYPELKMILNQNNIDYLHFREFSPSLACRRKFQATKDWNGFSKEFKAYLGSIKPAVEVWGKNVQDGDCLLCLEQNDRQCHRSLLYPYIPYSIILLL